MILCSRLRWQRHEPGLLLLRQSAGDLVERERVAIGRTYERCSYARGESCAPFLIEDGRGVRGFQSGQIKNRHARCIQITALALTDRDQKRRRLANHDEQRSR
jgi:hypothetical protein